jgi:hypothetical protein
MMAQSLDQQYIAQAELDKHIEEQAQSLAPEFEIDGDIDADFGTLYRVWKRWELLGTFYRDLSGKWVAQPIGTEIESRFDTDNQAILAIIAVTGNLAVDAA